MIVITSAAFISTEFQVELGRIPPAFMPLGNKRLYEHQVSSLRNSFPEKEIYLSITDAYKLKYTDSLLLKKLKVNIIKVPDSLTLGDSLLFVINSIGVYDGVLRVLHGDTYIEKLPSSEDMVALAEADDEYEWEVEVKEDIAEKVWCGYFAFSDIKLITRSLTAERGRFVDAVRLYQKSQPLVFPLVTDWLDMGHVNTYFRSRSKITTQRFFNELKIANGVVVKSSEQILKIHAEANWFVSIPHILKRYVPQFIYSGISDSKPFYELEYLPHLPLNELYVYGSLSPMFWRKVFNRANKLLIDFHGAINLAIEQREKIQKDFIELLRDKTLDRLMQYADESGSDPFRPTKLNGKNLPSLSQIALECKTAAMKLPARPGVLHGDFCFSNILYDSRADSLKLLDPRGMNAKQEITTYGDLRYDIAKFTHSVIGLYDHIVAGCFTLKEYGPLQFDFEIQLDETILAVQRDFEKNILLLGFTSRQIMPIVILLFISMLPLHADNHVRQRALLANALRLFGDWKVK